VQETDRDCGGWADPSLPISPTNTPGECQNINSPTGKKCSDGKGCRNRQDCLSGVCDVEVTRKCLAPTCSDGVQNGRVGRAPSSHACWCLLAFVLPLADACCVTIITLTLL
jgi:hypothetical protein